MQRDTLSSAIRVSFRAFYNDSPYIIHFLFQRRNIYSLPLFRQYQSGSIKLSVELTGADSYIIDNNANQTDCIA